MKTILLSRISQLLVFGVFVINCAMPVDIGTSEIKGNVSPLFFLEENVKVSEVKEAFAYIHDRTKSRVDTFSLYLVQIDNKNALTGLLYLPSNMASWGIDIRVFDEQKRMIAFGKNQDGWMDFGRFNIRSSYPVIDTIVQPVLFPGIGDTITVHVRSHSPVGNSINGWSWKAGSGSWGEGGSATRIVLPSVPGDCLCSVSVSDERGLTSKQQFFVMVNEYLPVANAGLDTAVGINDTVNLCARLSRDETAIVRYEWKFGDNWTVSKATDTFFVVSSLPGIVVCSLRVTDDDGNTSVASKKIYVELRPPTAQMDCDTVMGIGDAVYVDASKSRDETDVVSVSAKISKGQWVHADDTSQKIIKLVAPMIPGVYSCSLQVTDDDGNIAYAHRYILVEQYPPSVVACADTGVMAREIVLLRAMAYDESEIVSLCWKCGEEPWVRTIGGIREWTAPEVPGVYVCSVRVEDDDGNIVFDRNKVYVREYAAAMTRVKAGEFMMGSVQGDTDDRPVHEKRIDNDFWMDRTEVTERLYRMVTTLNNSGVPNAKLDSPKDSISWFEAILFCNQRSTRDGFDTVYRYEQVVRDSADQSIQYVSGLSVNMHANGYRLPTETEWEYACRGLSDEEFFWKREAVDIYAVFMMNSGGAKNNVGTKKPNVYGLHDMSGNVSEWCFDTYSPEGYTNGGFQNDNQPRVIRGGTWMNYPYYLRSTYRKGAHPGNRYIATGFRCVRTAQ